MWHKANTCITNCQYRSKTQHNYIHSSLSRTRASAALNSASPFYQCNPVINYHLKKHSTTIWGSDLASCFIKVTYHVSLCIQNTFAYRHLCMWSKCAWVVWVQKLPTKNDNNVYWDVQKYQRLLVAWFITKVSVMDDPIHLTEPYGMDHKPVIAWPVITTYMLSKH